MDSRVLVLRRPAPVAPHVPALDASQRAVVEHRGPVLRVLGAPGHGQDHRGRRGGGRSGSSRARPPPTGCLVLAPTRVAAARLRDAVTARLGGTTDQPLARTHQSLGFGILREAAALRGDPPPRLLSGPEQDVILRDLLAGHAAGERRRRPWPESVHPALPTRGFRGELRDLLMRAVERGLDPEDLARLGGARPARVGRGRRVLRRVRRGDRAVGARGLRPGLDPRRRGRPPRGRPEALDRLRAGLRLVVVDDAQELTPAALRLLRVSSPAGGRPRAARRPRRRRADLPRRRPAPARRPPGRDGARTRGAVARRTGAAARCSTPPPAWSPTSASSAARRTVRSSRGRARRARSRCTCCARCARRPATSPAELRAAHLLDGVPVVADGGDRARRWPHGDPAPRAAPPGCRSCRHADVPVRDEPAVRRLLALLRCALDVAPGADAARPAARRRAVSPLGGADAVACAGCAARCPPRARRRRRPHQRRAARRGLLQPVPLGRARARGGIRPARARTAAARRAARSTPAARRRGSGRDGAVGDVERQRAGRAVARRGARRRPGRRPRRPRPRRRAWRCSTPPPGSSTGCPAPGPGSSSTTCCGQDIPGDTLVARAPAGEAVQVLTPRPPPGASGTSSSSPGCRRASGPTCGCAARCSAPSDLVDVRRRVAAATRARPRRPRCGTTRPGCSTSRSPGPAELLLVTAVRSDDEQPSLFLDVVDPPAADEPRPFTDVARPLTLPGLVAELRRELVGGPTPATVAAAVTALARLAGARVPGADPRPVVGPARRHRRAARCAGRRGAVRSRRPRSSASAVRAALAARAVGGDGPSVGAPGPRHPRARDRRRARRHRRRRPRRRALEARWGRLGLAAGWAQPRERAEAHGDGRAGWPRYFGEAAAAGGAGRRRERDRVALGRPSSRGRVDRIEGDADGRAAGRRPQDRQPASRTPTSCAGTPSSAPTSWRSRRARSPSSATASGGAALLQVGKAARRRARPCRRSRRSTPTTTRLGRATWSTRSPRAWPARPSRRPPGTAVRHLPGARTPARPSAEGRRL